jgi:predicted nucleotidyltransferase
MVHGAIIRSGDIRASLDRIATDYGLDAIYTFGSRAAEARRVVAAEVTVSPENTSDLDVGVLPEPDIRLDATRRADLVSALEAVFAPARVDLVVLPEASPCLALDIVTGTLLLARNTDREAEYQLFVLRRAGDLAPFERERRALVLAGGR